MKLRGIEIRYDVAAIPTKSGYPATPLQALDFRNAAMDLIEDALTAEGAGIWSGAEIGGDEVSFGFEVEDFALAEDIVRRAVADTPYAAMREIARIEVTDTDPGDTAPPRSSTGVPALSGLRPPLTHALLRLLSLPLRAMARRG